MVVKGLPSAEREQILGSTQRRAFPHGSHPPALTRSGGLAPIPFVRFHQPKDYLQQIIKLADAAASISASIFALAATAFHPFCSCRLFTRRDVLAPPCIYRLAIVVPRNTPDSSQSA